MAKASLASRDAVETSLGIQEGNVEIVAACCKIHQFPPNKKTGDQSDPFCCAAIELQRLNKEMEPDDSSPEWSFLSFGKDSLSKFHPGNAQSADDDQPDDLGEEVDTEGNTVYLADESARLNKKCKWMLFASALENCGFKPDVLGKGFFPDLIGTKGHVKTLKMERIEGSDKEPTALVFDKITSYPYSAKKATAAAKPAGRATAAATVSGKPNGKANGKPNGKPAASPESDENPASDKALEVMAELQEKYSDQQIPLKKLHALVQTHMIRTRVPGKLQKEVLALTDSEEWIGEAGFTVDDGSVAFA